ncbi:MAG: calcium/sodium antiporter [Candidatus Cloacimonadota bacterium]|nr:calcium/sodium antiporter [Candidatus Cloacimonadota bacterium]
MLPYFLLIFGFILLAKGADFFIDGASEIAQYFHVSPLFIGLTLAAFGTSAPEAAVSIKATLSGVNGIALGNVIGSNIANICLAIGIAALIKPLFFENTTSKKELPFLVLSTFIIFLFCLDFTNSHSATSMISRTEGIILLVLMVVFLFYLSRMAKNDRKQTDRNILHPKISLPKNILLTVVGGVAIIIGGNITVSNATLIAKIWGVSDKVIGISIVAFGTSVPEIVTAIVAIKKNQISIAVGNIVGSNLFNILFVLGIASTIKNISLSSDVIFDAGVCLFITILFFLFSKIHKKIGKLQGLILIVFYIGYMFSLFIIK